MYARTHKLPSFIGILLAVLIGVAAQEPAAADTHVTYSPGSGDDKQRR